MVQVEVYQEAKLTRPQVALLKRAVLRTLKGVESLPKKLKGRSKSPVITILLVRESTIRKLNHEYRKKNKPTDVLSFSQLELPVTPANRGVIGELFLCPAYIKRQAKEFSVSVEEELARLVIHGTLHLFGYDHETSRKGAKQMFLLQERTLEKLFPLLADRGDGVLLRRFL